MPEVKTRAEDVELIETGVHEPAQDDAPDAGDETDDPSPIYVPL